MISYQSSFLSFWGILLLFLLMKDQLAYTMPSNCPLVLSQNKDNQKAEKCWATDCPDAIAHYLLKYTCIPDDVANFEPPPVEDLNHEIILPNTQTCFDFEMDFMDGTPPPAGIDDCAGAWFQLYVVYASAPETPVYFAAIQVNYCNDPKAYDDENGGQTGAAILATVEDCNC